MPYQLMLGGNNVRYLKPSYDSLVTYSTSKIEDGIILNANEAPYNPPSEILDEFNESLKKVNFNRYPDMMNSSLCSHIAKVFNVKENQVTCGVGSDELLDVIFKAVLENNDKVISFSPSFSMYKVFTSLVGAEFIPVELNNNYFFDVEKMIQSISKFKPKLVCLCSPNNPTGQALSINDIEKIVSSTDALILLDLAYVDFASTDYTYLATKYDNLIVLRTFSKAYALASIRCGYAISVEENIRLINIVKQPYSLSVESALLAEIAITHKDLYIPLIDKIKQQRDRVYKELYKLGLAVYPSEANFIFVIMDDKYYDELLKHKIYIRKIDFRKYRITIGSENENTRLIEVLKCVVIN